MAYSKTTWATGDVIDAAKLNKIEDGIAANDAAIGGIAPYAAEGTEGDDDSITLNKKAGELYTAIAGNKLVKIEMSPAENVSLEHLVPVSALKVDNNGTVTYDFRLILADTAAYSVEDLSANDAVVLAKEA